MKAKDFFVKIGRRIKSNFGLKSALFMVICLGLLATDLLTKHFAEADGWRFTVIPHFIEVVDVIYNDGASLGWGSGMVPLFIALTFVAIPIFIGVILMLPERAALLKFCIYMALAGAIGNLVDRLAFGGVRDFISMDFGFISFVCNFADIWLMVGLVLAMLDLLFFNEWAAFPLTKKARAAQKAHKKSEEEKELASSGFNSLSEDATPAPDESCDVQGESSYRRQNASDDVPADSKTPEAGNAPSEEGDKNE